MTAGAVPAGCASTLRLAERGARVAMVDPVHPQDDTLWAVDISSGEAALLMGLLVFRPTTW